MDSPLQLPTVLAIGANRSELIQITANGGNVYIARLHRARDGKFGNKQGEKRSRKQMKPSIFLSNLAFSPGKH